MKEIKLCIICSSGGHLLQFIRLENWWKQYEHFWLTFNKPDAQYLLRNEKVYWGYHPTTRNYKNLIKNFFLTLRILFKERPTIIISTGAGIAIPGFYLAKFFKIKTIFIDAFNRVDSPTLTGKVVENISDAFYVQWPSQKRFYKKAKLLGRLL
ncbi:PssD/Cps14F family polysaccharide biosynthesis glycosyltransferase [Desulfobacter sp. UBA2225]|uniref:PssD/Cps14F family polysaccharide biosynthesis glycosyltransferase n=1 Tax=Desulfobacter sp. UBA2225 TaxID=1961413 RepID=UPI00257BB17D|nr:PssD/Cps14F family polysaccharide biosynthesis glycosyltransferase [Desulfobacter sp. UBA2225]